jgi:methyl-accepting chemotaxis protein
MANIPYFIKFKYYGEGERSMKWFRDCKIGVKLTIGFFILVLFTGIAGTVGVSKILQMDSTDRELYEINTVPLADIGSAAIAFQRIRVNLGQLILAENKEQRQNYASTVIELNTKLEEELSKFGESIRSEEIRREFKQLKTAKAKWDKEREELVQLVLSGQKDKATDLHAGIGNKLALEINERIDNLIDLKTADAKRKADTNSVLAKTALQEMVILLVASICIAVLLAW